MSVSRRAFAAHAFRRILRRFFLAVELIAIKKERNAAKKSKRLPRDSGLLRQETLNQPLAAVIVQIPIIKMTQDMNGKRVLVTGAGTGIGREIALEFARQGGDVAVHYSHNGEGAFSAAEEIRKMGGKAEVFKADFNEVAQVQELGKQAVKFLGGIDCLVNNAGITLNRPFFSVTPEQFDTLYNVNIRAQFFLTQIVTKDMLTRGQGTVCNITSIHGFAGAPEHSVYAGTKGAIIAYTRSLAVELAHQGIRVNAIAPGWVTVENYYQNIPGFNDADAAKTAYEKVPLARSGTKLEIAKLAVFLCSENSAYIVGQTIVADGGTTALMSLISDFRIPSTATFGKGYVAGV